MSSSRTEVSLPAAIFEFGLAELLQNGFDTAFAASAISAAVGEAFSIMTQFGSLPSYVLLTPIPTSTGPLFLPHSLGYGNDTPEDVAAMAQHCVLCAMSNHPNFDPNYYGVIAVSISNYCDMYATRILEGGSHPELPPAGDAPDL